MLDGTTGATPGLVEVEVGVEVGVEVVGATRLATLASLDSLALPELLARSLAKKVGSVKLPAIFCLSTVNNPC